MAGLQLSGHSVWKLYWKKFVKTCFCKKILLLLVWQALLLLSWCVTIQLATAYVLNTSIFLSYIFAPLIGWLADFKFGRYEVVKFGSIVSFLASILYYFSMITDREGSAMSTVLFSIATVVVSFGSACYTVALLPFVSDQIIGATSDELSAAVRWLFWSQNVGLGLALIMTKFIKTNLIGSTVLFAVPLAVIIISDCLCQQWLDRTHKTTNPIKLIIQVLNYTRKHRYPERRSAFTFIDEEQPTRIDYGKGKFGGPFTEEEVEDVKTFLRLLPLVICLSLSVCIFENSPVVNLFENDEVFNIFVTSLEFPLLLIPLYQLLLRRCFHNLSPSMLRCIGVGLSMCILGFILLSASKVWGVIVSDDEQRYIACTVLNATEQPDRYMEWYWKVGPCILYGIGKAIIHVLSLEFVIAQSPDKMKGFVMGIMASFRGIVILTELLFHKLVYTLCHDLSILSVLVVLFVIFLILSKRYTLRERNREINIQAIVEEHYERYLDQEEEYMSQRHY